MIKIYMLIGIATIIAFLQTSKVEIIDHTLLKMNSFSILSTNESELKSHIGSPVSLDYVDFEYLDLRRAKVLNYGSKGQFVFSADVNNEGSNIKGFVVKTNAFTFSYGNSSFKVGDSISSLSTIFPKAYLNKSDEVRGNDQKLMSVNLGYMENGVLKWMDGNITFVYNSIGIITSIDYSFAS